MNEKNIVIIIRYAPILLVLVLSIFATYFVDQLNKQQLKNEIKIVKDFYLSYNNKKLVEDVNRISEYIETTDKNSKEDLKLILKKRVYEAHAIATKIYEDNKDSKTKKEIFTLIKSALGSIIYNNGRGYFFIDDIDGRNLLQPLNKEIENKNLSELKDINGYQFKKTIMKTIKDKTERYDTYYWYKNKTDKKAYEKMSFYKYFEPMQLAIGTGEYIIDFEKELKQKVLNKIQNSKLNTGSYIFLFDYEGKVLVHQNKNLIGTSIINLSDKNNFKYIQEIIKLGKTNPDFITYFNSTLQSQINKKTSYIHGYKKWKWVFGSGYNDEELRNMIEKSKVKLKKKNDDDTIKVFFFIFVIMVLFLAISLILSKYLENIFYKYQQRIKKEESEFRNLFEHINTGLAICSVDGNLTQVNSKLIKILGYNDKNELINKPWERISSRDLTTDKEDKFNDLISQKITKFSIEKSYKKSDDTNIDLLITANSLEYNNIVQNILFSVTDITEIKRKDKVLFQQTKIASMAELISNIAHQWRQPLSVISTISSGLLVVKKYSNLTDRHLEKSLDEITTTTEHLSSTIESFQGFFAPKSKKDIFNIKKVINKIEYLLSSQLESENIKLIKRITNLNLISFENDFIQILISLINNSKDALIDKNHDRLILITADKSKDKKELVVSIKDNGGGIPDDIISKIFEPYFTTQHKSIGKGIGLYAVMELLTTHINGKISVSNVDFTYDDTKYKGAEFIVSLPIE